jgi:hypothetical protein
VGRLIVKRYYSSVGVFFHEGFQPGLSSLELQQLWQYGNTDAVLYYQCSSLFIVRWFFLLNEIMVSKVTQLLGCVQSVYDLEKAVHLLNIILEGHTKRELM